MVNGERNRVRARSRRGRSGGRDRVRVRALTFIVSRGMSSCFRLNISILGNVRLS
jgi:hypothetical protein